MKSSTERTIASLWVTLAASLLVGLPAKAQDTIEIPVSVTGGVGEVTVVVHENVNAFHFGATILAVHGFTETAGVWEPLIDELFSRHGTRQLVKRVIALDFFGGLYTPMPDLTPNNQFGNLLINDNIGVVIQVIDALRAQGLGPRVIMGHSMGALAVQGVQEALLSQGSSLAQHGVFSAILLAAVPVQSVPWTQAPAPDLSPYVVVDPVFGTYLDVPPAVAIFGGGYTKLSDGQLVSGTPTPAEMEDYVGQEPIAASLQLVGQLIDPSTGEVVPRPDARQGAFAIPNGTLLTVVSFSQDVLTPAVDQLALYEHLNGGPGYLYRTVSGPEAVHNMFITDPEGMLDQLFMLSSML